MKKYFFLPVFILLATSFNIQAQLYGPGVWVNERMGSLDPSETGFLHDMNDDGFKDILSAFWMIEGIYLNDGNNGFKNLDSLIQVDWEHPEAVYDDGSGVKMILDHEGIYKYDKGTVTKELFWPFPTWGRMIAYEDLDGDGTGDIVYGQDAKLFVGFIDSNRINPIEIDWHPRRHEYVMVRDMNDDGLLEIVSYSDFSTQDIRIFWNQGNREFEVDITPLRGNLFYNWMDITDFDGDGQMDIIHTGPDSTYIHFGMNGKYDIRTGIVPGEAIVGKAKDLDNDGRVDIVLQQDGGTGGDDQLIAYYNVGGGAFLEEKIGEPWTFEGSWEIEQDFIHFLQIEDIDSDGDQDILMYYFGDGRVWLYENGLITSTDNPKQSGPSFSIIPTVSNTSINIQSDHWPLRITNVNGQLIQNIEQCSSQLDISNLSYGFYFLVSPKTGESIKFLKM